MWNGTSSDKVMIVTGRVKYDAFGRVKEACYPKVEEMSQKLIFDTIPDSQTPTRTTYDVLDRVLMTKLPDGTRTLMSYANESGLLKTTVTDTLQHSQASFTNGSGQTVKNEQYSGPNGTIRTTFGYDAINPVLPDLSLIK